MEFCEIEEDAAALKVISCAYAGRRGALTAVLQYVYQTVFLSGSGKEKEARAMEELAARRLADLETLGALVKKLGADPIFAACPPYPVSYHCAACVDYIKSFEGMVEADLAMERGLKARFYGMLPGLSSPALRAAVSSLAERAGENERRLEGLAVPAP